MAKKRGGKQEGAGRPRTEIDWKIVDEYLEAQTPSTEIAALIGISVDTLYLRCKQEHNIDYTVYSQRKRSKGVESLRCKLYKEAMENANPTLLIFLAKSLLGMSDKVDITTNGKDINTASRVVFDFTGEESDEVKESEVSDESEIEED